MPASHHPTELMKLIDPDHIVEHYRSISCDHYGDCLDEAIERRWTSWTCAHCPLFALHSTEAVEGCGAAP